MCLQERRLRGCKYSSVWAVPYRIVWAQPHSGDGRERGSSDSKWWTGMVLAGGKGTGISGSVSDVNMTRLPSNITTSLLRSRVKTAPLPGNVSTFYSMVIDRIDVQVQVERMRWMLM